MKGKPFFKKQTHTHKKEGKRFDTNTEHNSTKKPWKLLRKG